MRTVFVALVLCAVAAPAQAQKCKGSDQSAPDTTLAPELRTYRECDVDRKASLKGSEPRLQYQSSGRPARGEGCLYAKFDFVVDTAGRVDLATVAPRQENDRELEEAVKVSLPSLKYEPARIAGKPVRQRVFYQRWIAFMTVVQRVEPGSSPMSRPPSSARRPNC